MAYKPNLFLDSCFLIAFYLTTDTQHQKSVSVTKKLEKIKSQNFVNSLIILEVLSVIKIKNSLILAKAKNDLFNPQMFAQLEEKFFLEPGSESLKIFEENPKISITDANIIETCLANNLILLTFDKNLIKVARKYQVKVFK